MNKEIKFLKRALGTVGAGLAVITLATFIFTLLYWQEAAFCNGLLLFFGTIAALLGFDVIKTDRIFNGINHGFAQLTGKYPGLMEKGKGLLAVLFLIPTIICAFYGSTYFWSYLSGERELQDWDGWIMMCTGPFVFLSILYAILTRKK